jgi:hypothetical protein
MRLTLPSVRAHIFVLAACSHPQTAVPPGPPIPAEPDLAVGTADEECAAFEAALDTWTKCPNMDDDKRAWIRATKDFAEESYAAGKKSALEPQVLHAIAVRCRRAASSVKSATIRCNAGREPRVDW